MAARVTRLHPRNGRGGSAPRAWHGTLLVLALLPLVALVACADEPEGPRYLIIIRGRIQSVPDLETLEDIVGFEIVAPPEAETIGLPLQRVEVFPGVNPPLVYFYYGETNRDTVMLEGKAGR